jgi:hypothetical protein
MSRARAVALAFAALLSVVCVWLVGGWNGVERAGGGRTIARAPSDANIADEVALAASSRASANAGTLHDDRASAVAPRAAVEAPSVPAEPLVVLDRALLEPLVPRGVYVECRSEPAEGATVEFANERGEVVTALTDARGFVPVDDELLARGPWTVVAAQLGRVTERIGWQTFEASTEWLEFELVESFFLNVVFERSDGAPLDGRRVGERERVFATGAMYDLMETRVRNAGEWIKPHQLRPERVRALEIAGCRHPPRDGWSLVGPLAATGELPLVSGWAGEVDTERVEWEARPEPLASGGAQVRVVLPVRDVVCGRVELRLEEPYPGALLDFFEFDVQLERTTPRSRAPDWIALCVLREGEVEPWTTFHVEVGSYRATLAAHHHGESVETLLGEIEVLDGATCVLEHRFAPCGALEFDVDPLASEDGLAIELLRIDGELGELAARDCVERWVPRGSRRVGWLEPGRYIAHARHFADGGDARVLCRAAAAIPAVLPEKLQYGEPAELMDIVCFGAERASAGKSLDPRLDPFVSAFVIDVAAGEVTRVAFADWPERKEER